MKAKKLKGMVLLMTAIFGLSSCGQKDIKPSEESTQKVDVKESATEESESKKEEIVNLTVYSDYGFGWSEAATWYQEYLKETLGVTLESISAEASEMMPALLASGELPDIVGFKKHEDLTAAIEGGLVISLEEYQDQLPNVFGDEHFRVAIEYIKDNASAGTGKVYMLPINVGRLDQLKTQADIRWDIYKKVGYPEVNNWDELLDLLKLMQDTVPQTEAGEPIYAYSLWSSFDTSFMHNAGANYVYLLGHTITGLCEINLDGSELPKCILDDDSLYKEGLQYLFDANQMGLVDPDSSTQDYTIAEGKCMSGRVLIPPYNWYRGFNNNTDTDDFEGYYTFMPDFMSLYTAADQMTGNGWYLAISSECENVDKALAFLNWYYSEEANEFLFAGPEGFLWEYKDGIKVPTDTYLAEGLKAVLEGGGTVSDARGIINGIPRSEHTRSSTTGQRVNVLIDFNSENNKLVEDWAEHNDGYNSALEKVLGADVPNKTSMKTNFVPVASSEMQQLTNLIGETVKKYSWQMVFAKDQKEFDALWKTMQDEAKEIGIDKVVEDHVARWNQASEMVDKYMK